MLDDLLQPTKYHDTFEAWVVKRNPYHDKTGAFTSKDKAAPLGPAQVLAQQHVRTLSADEILKNGLPKEADQERFNAASEHASKEHASGRSSKKENTKAGTNSYTAARLLLHRQVIDTLFGDITHAQPAPGESPKVVMIGGRSGSGKGAFAKLGVYDKNTTIVLDPDVIKGMLPGYDPQHATLFHQESADIFDKAVALARKRGLNVVLDFTMSSDKAALARSFKKAGYRVEAHYMHRPPEKAAAFAIQRWMEPSAWRQLDGSVKKFPHGRIVPLDVVLDQTKNEQHFDKLRQHADVWSLYDNSRDRHDPRLVESSAGRHLTQKWYKDALGRFTSKLKATFGGGHHTAALEKFTKDNPQEGRVLNGVAMELDDNPDFSQSVNREFDEPQMVPVPGKHVAAGVVVTEPDGRVWVVQPKNFYGGYKNTFPKGTVKPGEDLQETAAREVWEESGLVVKITGHLVDVERGFSKTRFYRGERVGGAPWMAGRESYAVKLMPIEGKATEKALENVVGKKTTDQQVIDALRKHTRQKREGNPYHDKSGSFTTKEKAVEPLWEKSFREHWKEEGGTSYHGTSSAAIAAIRAEGLKPAGGVGADSTLHPDLAKKFMVGDRLASVFMMEQDDYMSAQREALVYAKIAAKANPGSEPVLLIIRLPKKLVKQLKKDERNVIDMAKRLKTDRIPPEWIKVVKTPAWIGQEEEIVALRDEPMTWAVGILLCKESVKKTNPYKDALGLFTTKERAVKPGWYKSHGGHHVEVGSGGVIVSGTHAGKTAQAKHFAAGPFSTHAQAKAHGSTVVAPPKPTPTPPSKVKVTTAPILGAPVPLSGRSVKIEALLKSGAAPKHAILTVQQDAGVNATRVKAIGKGAALDRAVKEYSETPTQDLDVLTAIEVHKTPVSGQAHCTWDRKVVMGSSSVTGDFRHELGHAIHMSLSQSLQDHVIALHAEALAKVAKFPAKSALTKELSHEFYEKTYGVIGRRALDNWHEDFAEHYRGYVKAVHQVKHGKDPKALETYTARHPKWSKFWDAYYAGGAS